MKKEIFIIHESEIIRRGINAIIRSYFNMDITQLSEVAKLNSFSNIFGAHLIVFLEFRYDETMTVIERLKTNNQVHIIQINPGSDPLPESPGVDGVISHQSPSEDIYALLADIVKSEHHPAEDKSGNSDLSSRERDVLQLVALGHSNKEIADKLFISIHTVISHRKNITEKLGIKSISGLTVYAILNKIIDPDRISPENLI